MELIFWALSIVSGRSPFFKKYQCVRLIFALFNSQLIGKSFSLRISKASTMYFFCSPFFIPQYYNFYSEQQNIPEKYLFVSFKSLSLQPQAINMHHESQKVMTFYFLERINYNQTWEEIEFGMGYDLGDFNFKNPVLYDKIKRLARQIHIELNGVFNKEGN